MMNVVVANGAADGLGNGIMNSREDYGTSAWVGDSELIENMIKGKGTCLIVRNGDQKQRKHKLHILSKI